LLAVARAAVKAGEELLQIRHGEGEGAISTSVSESEDAQPERAEMTT
jgi:hypothetical protein